MEFNRRFPVLSRIATILWITGLWVVIASVFGLGSDVAQTVKAHAERGAKWTIAELVGIAAGLGRLVFGFATMAAAEVIAVLFAIEKNTRGPGED